MTKSVFERVFAIAIVVVIVGISHCVMNQHLASIQRELKKIDDVIAHGNGTTYTIMDTQERILHYISGHASSKTEKYCPECGMIQQLVIRQSQIYDETYELSEFVETNKSDTSVPDKQKKLKELFVESENIAKFLFNADESAKRLKRIMEPK